MDSREQSTYDTIEKRLEGFMPAIVLKKHVAGKVQSSHYTLDGITFQVADRQRLLEAFREAKDEGGQTAFAEGSKIDPKHWYREGIKGDPNHWALNLSFGATNGVGFREIWRYRLANRSLRMADARPPGLDVGRFDRSFSANFSDDMTAPEVSSVHAAIWDEKDPKTQKVLYSKCNIHIDQVGFVMEGPNGEIVVNPDFGRHTGVELGLKTLLRGKLPDWAVDRFNPILPSSYRNFSRVGLSFDLVHTDKYRLEVSASCGIFGRFDCSATLNFSGKHNIFGSK